MREVKNYELGNETFEEQLEAKRYNPARVLKYRDRHGTHRITISAGSDDDVSVYREREFTLILSRNDRIGYTGLEVYEGDSFIHDVFLQNDDEIKEILGKRGLDLTSWTIVRRLSHHLKYRDLKFRY